VVELNRAVAVGLADGPAAGLPLLEPLSADPALERYQRLHAARAEPLSRAGDATGAVRACPNRPPRCDVVLRPSFRAAIFTTWRTD
jgi:predicted RNA polymerase sigma factor